MFIKVSEIYVLSLLEQDYVFHETVIKSYIETHFSCLENILNDKKLHYQIASSFMPIKNENGNIIYPSIATIKQNIESYKYLSSVYNLYLDILKNENVMRLGNMTIAITPNEIIVNGDAPIENKTNLVYNVVSLKILLDLKRSQNG